MLILQLNIDISLIQLISRNDIIIDIHEMYNKKRKKNL